MASSPFSRMFKRARHEDGLSLVELSFVVAIIAVLAAIAIPVFMGQQKQAHVATLQSDVTSTTTSLAAWIRGQGTAGANPTSAQFNTMRVQSDPANSITLSKYNMGSPATAELCVQGSRTIDGEVFRFHASTRDATLKDGPCVASPVLAPEQVGWDKFPQPEGLRYGTEDARQEGETWRASSFAMGWSDDADHGGSPDADSSWGDDEGEGWGDEEHAFQDAHHFVERVLPADDHFVMVEGDNGALVTVDVDTAWGRLLRDRFSSVPQKREWWDCVLVWGSASGEHG